LPGINVTDNILSDRDVTPLFVIPHEKERENVEENFGDDASIVFITTPGQVLKYLYLFCKHQTYTEKYR